jgi:hypothetical protein
MTYSARGIYSPLAPIHPAIFAASPEPVRAAWREVQDVQTRWQVAREESAALADAVASAKAKDAENAAKAVAAGKPIPKSLELQATDAVHEKGREVAALADLADRTERAFLEVLRDEADDLVGTFVDAADSALTNLLGSFADLENALSDYSIYVGAWYWLRSDMTGPLAVKRLTTTLHGVEQQTSDLLAWVVTDLRKQLPSAVMQREADARAAWEKERAVRQTSDGIVIDRAAYAELSG